MAESVKNNSHGSQGLKITMGSFENAVGTRWLWVGALYHQHPAPSRLFIAPGHHGNYLFEENKLEISSDITSVLLKNCMAFALKLLQVLKSRNIFKSKRNKLRNLS